MGNKASKAIHDSKKNGGKTLNLENCELTNLPKNITSQFPNLLFLNLSNNLVSHFFTIRNTKSLISIHQFIIYN